MLSERYVTFGRGKLLELAEALETVKLPGRFDMASMWIEKKPCGTTACALGWGVELGLLPGMAIEEQRPTYEGFTGYEAIMGYFGLDDDEQGHLFQPITYDNGEYPRPIPPTRVADRIRQFVKVKDVE